MSQRIYTVFILLSLSLGLTVACQQSEAQEDQTTKANEPSGSITTDVDGVAHGFVEVEGIPLFYRTEGSGRPIFVIHGGPGLEHSYLLPHLSSLGHSASLTFYDQRASGRSGGEASADTITVKRFVADLEALRVSFGHEKITLLSHSWGAVLALNYALVHPGHVDSMILLNPAPIFGRAEAHAAGLHRMDQRRSARDRAALSSLYVSKEFAVRDPMAVSHFFRLWFKEYFADPRKVEELNLNLTAQTAANALTINDLMNENTAAFDLIGRIAEIKARTLVIGGGQDVFPSRYTRILVSRLAHAHYVELDTSGHFSFIEDPQRVVDEINIFLDKG